ncbi:phosphotransferase [Bradyrhizobium sp.]|uniref:phosphotransferase n=1 Tax=Bradyrhizobium sp. TaxID=376 RepID=UPI0039E662CA
MTINPNPQNGAAAKSAEIDPFESAIRATLDNPPPAFSETDAQRILGDVFGFAATAKLTTGERDQNFGIVRDDGTKFVLKIANSAENLDVLDFQNQELEAVRRLQPDVPASRLVPATDGALLTRYVSDGLTYGVRLLTYLDGMPQARCSASKPGIRRDIGRISAALGSALSTVHHTAADYPLLWDMKHAGRLRRFESAISDPSERAIVARVLQRFESSVRPALDDLPWQPIHNDLNRNNILMQDVDSERISGIIDFGDSVYSPRVIDVAVTTAHQIYDQNDPIQAACEMISAYHAVVPLQDAELSVLVDLITTRLMMRLAIKGWRYSTYPDRAEYYEPSLDRPYLDTVERLLADRDRSTDCFRQACRP